MTTGNLTMGPIERNYYTTTAVDDYDYFFSIMTYPNGSNPTTAGPAQIVNVSANQSGVLISSTPNSFAKHEHLRSTVRVLQLVTLLTLIPAHPPAIRTVLCCRTRHPDSLTETVRSVPCGASSRRTTPIRPSTSSARNHGTSST
jgi:hypothetical protein